LRAGSEFFPKICAAAEDNYGANRGKDWNDPRDLHAAADASRIVRECNGNWHRWNYGNRRCKRSNLNAVAEPVRKTAVLSNAWAILPGLTLPAGGIRSIDGCDY